MLRTEPALSARTHPQGAMFSSRTFPARKPCQSVRRIDLRSATRPRARAAVAPEAATPDPLYLFYCARKWHKSGDTAAGWELVEAMRSNARGARALAAELLADTENGRLLVRDLRRTRSGLHEVKHYRGETALSQQTASAEAGAMNTPYGLQLVENCATCHLRKEGWYCALSADLLKSFSSFSHLTTYPGSAILFVEGQMPRGGFILCSGKVKLSTTSKEGKVLVLKVAEPGDIIGLCFFKQKTAYEITAETVGPCLVNFVERDGLLRLMERSGELGL